LKRLLNAFSDIENYYADIIKNDYYDARQFRSTAYQLQPFNAGN
jgi:hypothetical protein